MNAKNTRITVNTIRSLRPAQKDRIIRDGDQKGFQIKIPPTGNAVYQVEARLGGKGGVKKFKLGNVKDLSLDEARERARTALDKIRSGIDPLQEKRAQLHEGKTLRQLIETYHASKTLKPRTTQDYKILEQKCLHQWLDKRVKDISRHEILDWYTQGRNDRPTQKEQAFRFLNALMVFAMGLEIIERNPCELVTNARIRYRIKTRSRHLEVNIDLSKFLIAFTNHKFIRDKEIVSRDIIVLILTTGLRSKEARTLKWDTVDFERKIFTVPDTKNGLDHVVPMTPLTYTMFRYRKEHSNSSEYVFRIKGDSKHGHVGDFRKTLANICVKAGVPVVSAHDLRRTFATVLNSAGVGYADTKRLMNHKAQDITAGIYIQPDIDVLRRILISIVDRYDLKIPSFSVGQGCSQYAKGVMRYAFYKRGELVPELLDDPREEDPDWIRQSEDDFWEN